MLGDRKFRITGLREGGVMSDFSLIQTTFSTDDGRTIRCSYDPSTLSTIVGKLSEMVSHVRANTLIVGDHLVENALPTTDATAGAAVGGGSVVLMLKSSNGTIYKFGLEPQIASRLVKELGDAEKSASEQQAKTRQ
jgi:hypothetical protein